MVTPWICHVKGDEWYVRPDIKRPLRLSGGGGVYLQRQSGTLGAAPRVYGIAGKRQAKYVFRIKVSAIMMTPPASKL